MTTAIYAGSFDPLTKGHISILRAGLVSFDRIIVVIAYNSRKSSLFTVAERTQMVRDSVLDLPTVEVDAHEGLLVEYAQQRGVKVLLRGLRVVADFEHEMQMANMNRHLNREVETVFIMANDYFYVSSTLVKEAALLGGDIDDLVPPAVAVKLREKRGRGL